MQFETIDLLFDQTHPDPHNAHPPAPLRSRVSLTVSSSQTRPLRSTIPESSLVGILSLTSGSPSAPRNPTLAHTTFGHLYDFWPSKATKDAQHCVKRDILGESRCSVDTPSLEVFQLNLVDFLESFDCEEITNSRITQEQFAKFFCLFLCQKPRRYVTRMSIVLVYGTTGVNLVIQIVRQTVGGCHLQTVFLVSQSRLSPQVS